MTRLGRFIAAISVVAMISFALNFAVFIVCYNHLATPFLVEAQRERNADFIMSIVIGLFATNAVLTGAVACVACAWRQRRAGDPER